MLLPLAEIILDRKVPEGSLYSPPQLMATPGFCPLVIVDKQSMLTSNDDKRKIRRVLFMKENLLEVIKPFCDFTTLTILKRKLLFKDPVFYTSVASLTGFLRYSEAKPLPPGKLKINSDWNLEKEKNPAADAGINLYDYCSRQVGGESKLLCEKNPSTGQT